MESTWERRDLPVLDAVVRYLDAHVDAMPDVAQIAVITGRKPAEVHRALRAMEGRFIQVPDMSIGADAQIYFVAGVTPEARQAVGQWPSPDVWVDRLVEALREAAEREPDPERRSRLRAMAKGSAASPATWRSGSYPAKSPRAWAGSFRGGTGDGKHAVQRMLAVPG